MAYAAVASLSHTIVLILSHHEDSVSTQFKDQITSLHKHIIFLQSFIEDAPDRANNWEETIREVSDRAEDIIELSLSDSLLKSKSSFGLSRYEFILNYNLGELKRITKEMESIANRVKGMRTETDAMGGSDKELMKIISRLREGSSALEIIPIVGIGGMGKTTLARNAYNHPLIVEHFDIRAWSTVSTNRSLTEIISDFLLCMNMPYSASLLNSENQLLTSLYSNFYDMKFLIVLDDVWSLEALDRLKPCLPKTRNGSRIIITTRSLKLARSAGRIHEMSLLDDDKTWNLFRQKIFKGDPCPSQLEYVGKEIARKCRGHRLCIEVVSGILAADQTKAAWEDISENINIASEVDEILYLSYTYLPHHLRPCFLYLGIFPEDQDIRVSKLIKLWVAEGFLNESDECKSFEETGEENVEDLVRRNLVLVSKRKCNGRIKSIAIHDLMRDLCIRQALIDSFFLDRVEIYDRQQLQSCRRVSDVIYGDDFLGGIYGSTIRTIMLNYSSALGVKFMIGNVRLLRILDLSNAYNYDLAEEVFDLFHLRYLAFHSGFSISEAISNLENLQTLIICASKNDGGLFDDLPEGIWKMPQLRHLFIFRFELPSQQGAISALENLQNLSGVVDFICSRAKLGMIPNLRKLALVYTKSSRHAVEDYELHNLIYLQKLETLKIEMDWCFGGLHKTSHFAFPPTLKKLTLLGTQLPWEDMKVVALLPNLQVLKLRKFACIGETWETSEGGFSQLTYLLIEESNLVHWITRRSHFPRLECLVLNNCRRIMRVPHDVGEIDTLELIEVDGWNKTLLQSVKQIQQHRQSLGDDHLQISVKKEGIHVENKYLSLILHEGRNHYLSSL